MPNVTDTVRLHSARILGVAPSADFLDVRAALAQHVGEDNVDRLLQPTNSEAALLPETDRMVAAARFLCLTGNAQKAARLAFLVADAAMPEAYRAIPPFVEDERTGYQDSLLAITDAPARVTRRRRTAQPLVA